MFPRIFCALLISHGLLAAQEPVQTEAPASDEPAITDTGNGAAPAGPLQDVAATARTFIPSSLGVPLFTPPPPPVVKRLPAVRVDAAVTLLSKNARTLTLQRGEASTAPDLPPPPPPPPYVEPHQPTPEEIAQHIWQQRHNLNLGATIFDHKISLVNWIDQQSQVHYEAVCGFDIGLLAGVGGFVHNGEDYSIFLVHSAFDTTSVRHFASQWFPKIPEVAPGEILITRGDVKDIAATAPMTVIKEIIAAETPRLLPYQAARTTYFAASAAWNAAHPPIPRDETFVFRPHRGSRYLPATEGGKP
jgi:hypothetical protein